MSVQPVQSNTTSNDNLKTVVGYSAVGATLGYVTKYIVPASRQELEDSGVKATAKYIESQQMKKFKADVINDLRNRQNKTKAQDTFVKMYDNDKTFSVKSIRKNVNALGGSKSEQGKEFLNLINQINEYARNKSMLYVEMFTESYLKKIRPTMPFVIGGAVAGMLGGIVRNILKDGSTIDT